MQKRDKGFRFDTARMAMCAFFAAMTAVCAQLTIQIGAVPVSLSLLPVLLAAALLTPADAALSMAVYLLMGLCGLPVFSNFTGGPAKLFQVTGGYIIGYLPCAALIAILLKKTGNGFACTCLAMAAGVLVCYAFGTIWFMVLQGTDLMRTMDVCVWPFLPFDGGKILLAAFLARRLRQPLARARLRA